MITTQLKFKLYFHILLVLTGSKTNLSSKVNSSAIQAQQVFVCERMNERGKERGKEREREFMRARDGLKC